MRSRAGIQIALAGAALLVIGGLALWLVLGAERADPIVPAAPGVGGVSAPATRADEELSSTPHVPALDPSEPAVERIVAKKDARDIEPSFDDTELATAIWIEGRVELAAGTPLDEDAWVVAKGRDFERRPLHRSRIGPDGRFKVAFEKTTRTGWLVLAARYGYLAKPETIRMSKPPKDIVLKGLLGGAVTGRILLPASAQDLAPDVLRGRVLAGTREWRLFEEDHVEGRIFPDLRYEIGGIQPGVARHVSLTAHGFLPFDVGDVLIDAGKVTPRDIEPEVGTSIRGFVTAQNGAPVAGAIVAPIFRTSQNKVEHFGADFVRSSKDGAFELAGLKGGNLTLVVQKPGLAPLQLELGDVPVGSRKTGVSAVMNEGQSISGRVQFAEDKPAARAFVEVEEEWVGERLHLHEDEPSVETGPDGTFRVTGLTQTLATVTARYWVDPDEKSEPAAADTGKTAADPRKRVRRRGTPWTATAERVAVGKSDLVLTLTKGDAIRGRVVDSQGQPVERFTVRAEPDPSSEGCSSEVDDLERSFRAADGRFELDGLKPCTWSIHVSAKGLLDSTTTRVRMPGASGEIEFRLLRLARISGTVVGPDMQPVQGAEIACETALHEEWYRWETDARSDAKGAFTIRTAPIGPIKLVARAPNLAKSAPLRFDLGADTHLENLTLKLRSGATLVGTIAEADRKRFKSWRIVLERVGEQQRVTNVDEAGTFRFTAVTPGRYDLHAQGATEGASLELHETLDLVDGETKEIALASDAKTIRVHGKLVPPGLVAGFALTVQPLGDEDYLGGQQVNVSEDSTYEVHVPRPGQYGFQLGTNREESAHFRVHVPPGVEALERDLILPTGSIRGRVVDPDGSPVKNFEVELRGTTSRASDDEIARREASTNDNGDFEFRWVPEGTYELEAHADPFGWWSPDEGLTQGRASTQDVVVKAGESTSGIDLVVIQGGGLKGVVRNAAGALMPYVELHAFDAKGRAIALRGEPRTDNAGRFELTDLPLGKVFVLARTPTSAAKGAATVAKDSPAEIELVLAPCGTLSIRSVDAAGVPVWAGLEIVDADGCRYEEIGSQGIGGESTPADARVWSGLPAGRYAVRAQSQDGDRSANREAQVGGGQITNVTLRL